MTVPLEAAKHALETGSCLFYSVLREGLPVPHTDIHIGILPFLAQGSTQSTGLLLCDASQRRAPADLFVALGAFGGPKGGQEPG